MSLTEQKKQRLIQLIEQDKPLPARYKNLLFANEADYVERTAVYELQYKGKKSEPDILSRTPAAPLQCVVSIVIIHLKMTGVIY